MRDPLWSIPTHCCGNWEINTIIGNSHKQAIASLTMRKFRLTLINKIKQISTDKVTRIILKLVKPTAHRIHTPPSDDGSEFTVHKTIVKNLGTTCFFAHPYALWRRGLNENTHDTFASTSRSIVTSRPSLRPKSIV